MHTGEPDEQSMYPMRHELLFGEQDAPLWQAVHVPPLQTMFVPHGAPFWTFVALVHTVSPVAHDVMPDWQRLPPGLHAAFAVQLVHVPVLSQTWLVPHDVPGGALASVSWHEMPPLTQSALPRWQGLAGGSHGAPAVHAAHAPELQ